MNSVTVVKGLYLVGRATKLLINEVIPEKIRIEDLDGTTNEYDLIHIKLASIGIF